MKKKIIKSECKRNYDVFSYRHTGFTLCFSHVNLYFSHFCTSFFIGSQRIYVQKYIICSLLSGIDYVTDKINDVMLSALSIIESYIFLNEKHSFCPQS